jgi:hypothetical protein
MRLSPSAVTKLLLCAIFVVCIYAINLLHYCRPENQNLGKQKKQENYF